MAIENKPIKKMKTIAKSYDGFFTSLNDANKVSNKSYGKGKHIRTCVDFLVEYVKAQNTIIRWIVTLFTIGIPFLIAYAKNAGVPIIVSIPNSAYAVVGFFIFVLICWWLDRNTLLKVTEPTETLFHIGAYEKYRKPEYKRHFNYFNNEPLSFDELGKDLEEEMKTEKESHKKDNEYYLKTLKGKDDLLIETSIKMADLQQVFTDFSLKHYKLEILFQEVLIQISSISKQNIQINELGFAHNFTVHKIDSNEYRLVACQHPHRHEVGVNYPKKGSNHLISTERKGKEYVHVKDKLISFLVNGEGKDRLIVTLYPKTKPIEEMRSSINYDTMYIEDIISLWKSFAALIYSSNSNLSESKGEGLNVKEA